MASVTRNQTSSHKKALLTVYPRRHFFKWTINEDLKLVREHELLGLSEKQIALRHERTIHSIVCRISTLNYE